MVQLLMCVLLVYIAITEIAALVFIIQTWREIGSPRRWEWFVPPLILLSAPVFIPAMLYDRFLDWLDEEED